MTKAKPRLLRANSSKENFEKDTIDEKAIHRNRSMKLKQTLSVIHFEIEKRHSNKTNRAPTKLTLSIMTIFFNDINLH